MPLGFNIQQFIDIINAKGGFQRPNKFLVTISPPQAMMGQITKAGVQSPASSQSQTFTGQNLLQQLHFWCEGAHLPGVILMSQEVNRYAYGIPEKKPFRAGFQDMGLIFYADGQMENWTFFTKWCQLATNYDMSGGTPAPATHTRVVGGAPQPQDPYEVSYKIDYEGMVQVTLFDQTGQQTLSVVLRDAWPIFVSDVNLHWAENNQFMRFGVSMNFRDWYIGGNPYNTMVRLT